MAKRSMLRGLAYLACIVAAVIVYLAINHGRIQIELTTEEVQQKINAALEKRALEEKSVNVESAVVTFVDSSLVIKARASGILKSRMITAEITAKGTPEYRGGSFFFKPLERPKFDNVKIERVEKKGGFFSEKTKDLLKKGGEAVLKKFDLEPLAESLKDDFKQWTVSVAERGAEAALTKRPIYTLKSDFKGMTVRSVLEKVEVVGEKLVITLSLLQLAYNVVVAIILLVIALGIAFFLLRYPGWGLVLAFPDFS